MKASALEVQEALEQKPDKKNVCANFADKTSLERL